MFVKCLGPLLSSGMEIMEIYVMILPQRVSKGCGQENDS